MIGSTIVTTDSSGNASFTVNVPTLVRAGYWITTTATFLSTTAPVPILNAVETSTFSTNAIEAINFLIVTSTANTPTAGTLLSAINASNANPSVSLYLPNHIVFQIPGTGLQTIELAAGLPTITTPVVIDGYSQSGSQGNVSGGSFGIFDTQETDVATITVQIDGSGLGGAVNGLTIAAQNCTIDGLIITGFSGGSGIALERP